MLGKEFVMYVLLECNSFINPETSDFTQQIIHLVSRETNRGVQNMKVFLENGKMILTGNCQTFHTKQLAQSAILKVIDDVDLVNLIRVA
jgi:hypothetical protein